MAFIVLPDTDNVAAIGQVCVADGANGPDLTTSECNEGVISLRRVSGQALTVERMLQVAVEASLP